MDREIWSLIKVYDIHEDANKEEKDNFFKAILGHLNGHVGNQNLGLEKVLGRERKETKNDNAREE